MTPEFQLMVRKFSFKTCRFSKLSEEDFFDLGFPTLRRFQKLADKAKKDIPWYLKRLGLKSVVKLNDNDSIVANTVQKYTNSKFA